MGRRGPKPTPTAMLRLVGSPEAKRRGGEIKPPIKAPSPPSVLNATGKREWRRISKLLVKLGLLTEIDRAALSLYCVAYSRWWDAEQILKKSGTLLKSQKSGALYQNPMLAVANKALGQMHKILIEFGMTPSARAKIKVLDRAAEDALGEFVKRKQKRA